MSVAPSVPTATDPTTRVEKLSENHIYLQWRLEDLKSVMKPTQGDERATNVYSPNLTTFKDYAWQFCFQPEGGDKGLKTSCGLFLYVTYQGVLVSGTTPFSFMVHLQRLDRSKLSTSQGGQISFGHRKNTQNMGWQTLWSRDWLYFKNAQTRADDAIWITAVVSAPRLATQDPEPPLRYSAFFLFSGYAAVLDDPSSGDVAFIVKARKGQGSTRTVYACANVLAIRCPYFKNLLNGNWRESQLQVISQGQEEDATDLASISELLEESDAEVDDQPPVAKTSNKKRKKAPSRGRTSKDQVTPDTMKRQVTIGDASYVTFRGLIEFLMTDDIYLGPLLSRCIADSDEDYTLDPLLALEPDETLLEKLRAAHIERCRQVDPFHGDIRRPCSPKSLYILADRYDLPKLKKLCLDKIVASLDHRNVLWEILSPISATYPEVLTAELAVLRKHWSTLPKAVLKTVVGHPNFQLVWSSFSDHVEIK